MKSVTLRTEPTVRQADAILARLETELARRGAQVARQGLGLRFRMPLPWAGPRPGGSLSGISRGVVKVAAGAGEPWQVRYELDFSILRGLAALLTVVVIVTGLSWPRLTLLNVVVAVWLLLYLAPRFIAHRRFDRILRRSAVEILERRKTPRDETAVAP